MSLDKSSRRIGTDRTIATRKVSSRQLTSTDGSSRAHTPQDGPRDMHGEDLSTKEQHVSQRASSSEEISTGIVVPVALEQTPLTSTMWGSGVPPCFRCPWCPIVSRPIAYSRLDRRNNSEADWSTCQVGGCSGSNGRKMGCEVASSQCGSADGRERKGGGPKILSFR